MTVQEHLPPATGNHDGAHRSRALCPWNDPSPDKNAHPMRQMSALDQRGLDDAERLGALVVVAQPRRNHLDQREVLAERAGLRDLLLVYAAVLLPLGTPEHLGVALGLHRHPVD